MIQIKRSIVSDNTKWVLAGVAAVATVAALAIGLLHSTTHAISGSVVYVTPSNTQGWTSAAPLADTRGEGMATFVADADTPYGHGALALTTSDSNTDKVQYMKAANVPLSSINALGYSTKQVSASFAAGLPSFQLPVCLYGATSTGCNVVPGTTQSSFTTLVYEPYVDKGNAAVLSNTWQTWDVYAGKLWSSKSVAGLVGSAGSPTYQLSDLQAQFPDATLLAYGVDVGSYNPSYDTRVDGVVVNNTTYDFELRLPAVQTKDECKNSGWMNVSTANGSNFKNQGQCVSYVEHQ